jgi:hypothetical protein
MDEWIVGKRTPQTSTIPTTTTQNQFIGFFEMLNQRTDETTSSFFLKKISNLENSKMAFITHI